MDKLLEGLGSVLAGLGLPGVVIAAMFYAIWFLYNANEKKSDLIAQLTRETVKANETTLAAINGLSDLIRSGWRQQNNGGS